MWSITSSGLGGIGRAALAGAPVMACGGQKPNY